MSAKKNYCRIKVRLDMYNIRNNPEENNVELSFLYKVKAISSNK
jgi:hypothetical protein